MSLRAQRLLKGREGKIFKVWRDKVYALFPPETVRILKKEADRFENPMGFRLEEGLKDLLKELFQEDLAWDRIDQALERIIKLEAVQAARPSEALSFLYYLKSALREVLGEELLEEFGPEALLEVEDRIDVVALRAFNHYMAAREKLYDLRVQEWKSRLYLLLRRAGYLYDSREGSPLGASDNEKSM